MIASFNLLGRHEYFIRGIFSRNEERKNNENTKDWFWAKVHDSWSIGWNFGRCALHRRLTWAYELVQQYYPQETGRRGQGHSYLLL